MWRKAVSIVLIFVTMGMNLSCVRVIVPGDKIKIKKIRRSASFIAVRPSRATMKDGSLIYYREGFTAKTDTIFAAGIKYSATGDDSAEVSAVSLGDIRRIEYYQVEWELNQGWQLLLGITIIFAICFGLHSIPPPEKIYVSTIIYSLSNEEWHLIMYGQLC